GWWHAFGQRPIVQPLVEQSDTYYRTKRVLDAVLAGLLIIGLLPLLPLIAIAILIETGRPVFFSQERIGSRRVRLNGEWVWRPESFTCYKFRTMYVGQPAKLHEDY